MLAKPVDLQDRTFVLLLGFQHRRADSAAPGEFGGHRQRRGIESEGLAQRVGHARILRDRADQRHRRLHGPAFHNRALEIARHRVAQSAQDLGGGIALLLRVDHVALGEHRAAPGDARRATGAGTPRRPPLPPNTACAAPADRGTIRCPRRIRRSGRSRQCCRRPGGCTWSFRRRFRIPCGPADRAAPIMRAMALNSFSKNRPRTLAMVRLPEPVTRMPSTRSSGTTS